MSIDSMGSSGTTSSQETSAVQSNSGSGSPGSGAVNGSTRIPTVEALREIAPKVYDQMLIGIGTTACKRMQRSQERIKKMMRKDQAHEV